MLKIKHLSPDDFIRRQRNGTIPPEGCGVRQMPMPKITAEVKALLKRTSEDVIAIGRLLFTAQWQKHMGPGKWNGWIKEEFGMARSTAAEYINTYKSFVMGQIRTSDTVPPNVLIELARPTTPQAARDKVEKLAKTGTTPTVREVRKMIREERAGPAVKGPQFTSKEKEAIRKRKQREQEREQEREREHEIRVLAKHAGPNPAQLQFVELVSALLQLIRAQGPEAFDHPSIALGDLRSLAEGLLALGSALSGAKVKVVPIRSVG